MAHELLPHRNRNLGICTSSAADLDGNLFRVFYDFAWELPDRGGRADDTDKQNAARAST